MFDVSFKLIPKGWVQAMVTIYENDISIFASRLSDGLSEMVISAWRLAEGENEVICSWQEEPGQNRWVFKKDGNQVDIKLLWFEDTFSKLSNSIGKEVFSTKVDFVSFIRKIIIAFDKLIYEYGTETYKDVWTYDFPEEYIIRLKASFKKIKNTP